MRLGSHHSEETKRKFVGRIVTLEMRRKIRAARAKQVITPEQRQKMSDAHRGTNNHLWSGDRPSYSALHHWLVNTYGRATRCENLRCLGKGNRIEWALLRGRSYRRR